MSLRSSRRFASLGFALLLLTPCAAWSDALSELIERVGAQTRLSTPLRADVDAEIDYLEGKKHERIVAIFRNHPTENSQIQTYIELDRAKLKFLILGDAQFFAAAEGKMKPASLDTPVDSTSWVLEDLLPFLPSRCNSMRVADLTPEQVTVACEPKKKIGSDYSLFVFKFDREKSVPLQVLYYRDTLSNLVKLRRDEDFELVGSRWRPKRVTMQDFKLRTKDVFEIRWTADPKLPPALFDSRSFAGASTIVGPKPLGP